MIDDRVENIKWLKMSIRSFFGFGFNKSNFFSKSPFCLGNGGDRLF